MKRLNKKILTFLLAGACAASLCAATINVVSSADEATGVSVSSVFAPATTNGGKVDVETGEGAETGTLRFTLAGGESVYLKRDLALKWYEDVEDVVTEKYMSMKFSFKNTEDFKSVTFTTESASSVVTEENKAVNEVTFSVEDGALSVSVNDGEKQKLTGADVSLSLKKAENGEFGSFDVDVNGVTVGTFKNVGANYADYALGKTLPLSIKAETEADKTAVVLFKELNGQKFDDIKEGKVTDTAAPVLVVNEEISSFQYGTAFSLNYEKIDVLQEASVNANIYYYQYNPADTETNYDNKLTTTTYFMDTVYYTDGTKAYKVNNEEKTLTATSVRSEEGREYVSVKVSLSDKADQAADYYLSWYANTTESKTLGEVTTDYIIVDKNSDGPTYSYLVADADSSTNKYEKDGLTEVEAKKAFEDEIEAYQSLLQDEAKETKASSDSSIKLPALDWLIKDNGGYRGLRFTISYKTPSSTTAKAATNLQYSGLKFTTSEEGTYVFKVFATDVSGNAMEYYDEDGELVALSSTNVWDIEEIPFFEFEIADAPISVKETTKNTDKKAEKTLDSTYTLSGLTVEGASNAKSEYALYRFDDFKYEKAISESTLLNITYADLTATVKKFLQDVGAGKTYATYFDLYVHVYSQLIAEALKGAEPTAEEIKAVEDCFVKIEEYNAEITEENDKAAWKAYNQYEWDVTGKSFKAVNEGNYFIFADFHEDYLPSQRAAAYKLIVVDSKIDVIKGESQVSAWIKNNVLSVVLFGVAGVMLIAIIVLLLVQPSEETLEDVDEETVVKKKTKKDKKNED